MPKLHRFIRLVIALGAFAGAAALMLPSEAAAGGTRLAAAKATYQGQVNVNTASEKELAALPGIGRTKARRIVAARPFARPADLMKVKGIGRGTLKKLTPYVKVQGKSDFKKVK